MPFPFSPRVSLWSPLLGIALCCFPAAAQSGRVPRFGIDAGAFFPSNSKVKDVFGSRFTSIGPGFGETSVPQRKLYPDLDFLHEKRGGNRATVVFAGAKLLIPLGDSLAPRAGFAPYSGVGFNLTYASIDAPSVGVNDWGYGIGASAILGASFGGRFFGEGRYRLASSAASFNFSGAQVVIGARF